MGENLREAAEIHLETVANRMDTEKRRIYDIVNVMEALDAMSKTNKSFYRWNTLASLPQLMELLKASI
jgi:transcription factor E2F7/8